MRPKEFGLGSHYDAKIASSEREGEIKENSEERFLIGKKTIVGSPE